MSDASTDRLLRDTPSNLLEMDIYLVFRWMTCSAYNQTARRCKGDSLVHPSCDQPSDATHQEEADDEEYEQTEARVAECCHGLIARRVAVPLEEVDPYQEEGLR
jgi:hypothetical protein